MIYENCFVVVNSEGWQLGYVLNFKGTAWLFFDSYEECIEIAKHWKKWIEQK